MADDIWQKKVENDLREDVDFYNKEVEKQAENIDPKDSVALAQLEQTKRERDQRLRELKKVR